MAYYLNIGAGLTRELASLRGWREFKEWARKLDPVFYQEIVHLAEYGWEQDLDSLLEELEHALTNIEAHKDVASVTERLISLVSTGVRNEVAHVSVTDGLGPDDGQNGEWIINTDCGAGSPGGRGFTRGNTCASGSGGSSYTPTRPEGIDVLYDPDYSREQMEKDFGLTEDQVLALAGVQEDSGVDLSVSYGSLGYRYIHVSSNGEGYYSQRDIFVDPKDPEGNYIRNASLEVDTEMQGQGLGTKILGDQVDAAAALGFNRIETTGVGSGRDPYGGNGYYTWPRLGFNARLLPQTIEKAKYDGFDVEKVSELMVTPEGRKWWKENGHVIDLTFSLKKNSLSRRVLDAYRKERQTRARATAGSR